MNRFDSLFARTRDERRLALLPYFTAGFPELQTAETLAKPLQLAGADGFELCVPFSDPIADGPSIQRSTTLALRNGMTVAGTLAALEAMRQNVDVPIALMGYFNPFLRYGIHRLVDEAADKGADAFIVPDLPLEEASAFAAVTQARGLHLVLFVAPTSTEDRLQQVGELGTGFVYCVAVQGVTGARAALPVDIDAFLARVRCHVKVPVVVGFGLSRPEHLHDLRDKADGAIVASAIVDLMSATPVERRAESVVEYVRTLAAAARGELMSRP